MNTKLALELGRRALAHLKATAPEDYEWSRETSTTTFQKIRLRPFLQEYCWVVYASGFRFAVVKAKFPEITRAFRDFRPEALRRMRSVKPVLQVFNNQRKAQNFLDGAHAVIDEGFGSFKKRMASTGAEVLRELPGIGPITKDHLAKNIGLSDTAKADIWLQRAARRCNATVENLVRFLSDQFKETQHTIGVALWTYGKDGLLSAH